MTQSRLQRIQDTLSQRQQDVTVLLDQVHKPHNLSAIIRTCDAVGIPKVHAIESKDQPLRAYRSTSQGSERWVDLEVHNNPIPLIKQFQQEGKQVLAAQLSDKAVDFREIDFTKPTALVMGAEKWGVSEETANAVDQHIIIPMHGMVESLNVSVATALILFEMQRQRLGKGFYDKDKTICSKNLFEWIQPKMAKLCQQKGWPYPELDQDGDILNPSDWMAQMKKHSQ
ncbi:tRNA (guanosine(18)-2'-O)-methyltransferase TrmH [Francisellaceae bacterium]|nr:tRNA (guanosine(18)-2'-O)-methyltransferase TrmH [Francisellaceae bacterium]